MNASSIYSSSFALLTAAASLSAAIFSGAALAAPGGELDSTFGDRGRLNLSLDRGLDIYIGWRGSRALAAQPAGGKLLIGGSRYTGPSRSSAFAVVRLHPDGSLDEGFGEGGVATVDFSTSWEDVTGLLVQPDGKIVVAGAVNHGADSHLAIARLNTEGTPDQTFGSDGRATLDLDGAVGDYVAEIALSPDGKLVLVGATRRRDQYDIVFARFLPNGALDETFGTGPIIGTTIIDSGMSDEPTGLIGLSDGKWIACGKRHVEGAMDEEGQMLAVRLNADGSVDAGFGKGGLWHLEDAAGPSGAGDCALLADGNVVLAGFVGPQFQSAPALVRLRPDGALDASFGIATIDFDGSARAQAIVVLGDGDLAVTGEATPPYDGSSHPADMFFARIDADTGLVDPAFGREGITIVDFRTMNLTGSATGSALIQQADGKLTALGHVGLTDDFWDAQSMTVLARVDPDGAGSPGFVGFFDWVDPYENAGEAILTVRRTGGSTGSVSVDYEAVAGSAEPPGDFTAASGTLTWTDGDMDVKRIIVPITDDAVNEGLESFQVRLVRATAGLAWSDRKVVIHDGDAPPATLPGSSAGPRADTGEGGGGALGLEALLLLAAAFFAKRDAASGSRRRERVLAHWRAACRNSRSG